MLRLVFHSAGVMEVKKARIVYMGKPSTEDSDFAIVHVPVPLSEVFVWADRFAKGNILMCSGSSQNEEASNYCFKTVLSGGAIQEVGPSASAGNPFQIVRHSAPIFHGNSGGPAVDKDGRLVAVNFAATFSTRSMGKPARKYSIAIRLDLSWLKRLIDKDAAEQSGGY